jgi:hypothetical protein
MDIKKNIKLFTRGSGKNKGRKADERYASFDYCFNYFQSFKEGNKIAEIAHSENMLNSCLHLAYYIASWGMLRGSSFLLEKSLKFYVPLIKYISQADMEIWDIDVDSYNDKNINLLLELKNDIGNILGKEHNPSDTLITKIMLGVFSNIPAFDTFFRKAFSLYRCNGAALVKIAKFYNDNKIEIDSYKIYTFDFNSGGETNRMYKKAKLIDMIGFIEGQIK